MMPRALETHEVYHSFALELEGGKIKAIPKKSEQFDAAEHKKLSGTGYEGFKAIEDLVQAGTRVKIFGTAKQEGDGWVLHYTKLEVAEAGEAEAEAVPKKKKKVKSKAKVKGKKKPK